MITITIIETGQWAEADSPEGAILAARTMASADREGRSMNLLTARFSDENEVTLGQVPVKELWKYVNV